LDAALLTAPDRHLHSWWGGTTDWQTTLRSEFVNGLHHLQLAAWTIRIQPRVHGITLSAVRKTNVCATRFQSQSTARKTRVRPLPLAPRNPDVFAAWARVPRAVQARPIETGDALVAAS
jgi:hypothetical protein